MGFFSVHLVPGHKSQKDKERRTNGTEIEKMQKRTKIWKYGAKEAMGTKKQKGN